jgi:glycosyltransferase involved in cell wall biosynthesis
MKETAAGWTIVHVDTGLDMRGGQVQLLMLARGLAARGHRPWIVCPEGSALESRARKEGFGTFALPPHDPAHAHGILELRRTLNEERVDIIHAHDGKGQTISWLSSAGLRVERVASRRVTFRPRRSFDSRVKYGYGCHSVIAVSSYVKNLIVASGISESHVEIIPDGCDLPEALADSAERRRLRATWGLTERDFVIGHVGAFAPEKGQDVAVEAALLLRAKRPDFRWLFAGQRVGEFAEQLERMATPAGEIVRLVGYVESLPDFLTALDLFILPSRAEGLGSSALWAMAHGLPVVASWAGGIPEIVEGGKTGWLVEPQSPRALAEAVADAANDPRQLVQMGLAAREKAKGYSSDIMVERTLAVYGRLHQAGARSR